MKAEEIEVEALRLDSRDRARLAHQLLRSLEALPDEDADQAWLEEAERRNEDIESDRSSARPADDVLREARARLK
jgi:hypothetical protein